MAEALAQVKNVMGSDAVILHTRTFHTRSFLGLRRREMVEITAGRGFNVGERNLRRQQSRPAPTAQGQGIGAYGRAALPSTPAPAVPRNALEGSRQLMETPGASSAAMLSMTSEMSSLKSMVKDLVTHTRQAKCPQVPENLFEYYLQLVENKVTEELAADIVQTLQKQMRPEHLAQPEFVKKKLAQHLEKLLPTAGPIVRTKTRGPHVVALIGPTGVGKTTTLAKLAANLKLRENRRVGLITLDTYRIAAVDQIKKYADVMGAPLRVVSSTEDLREAVDSMSDCEFVLIDTAGRSPNDTLKLNELKALLAVVEPDEVHLVLSTTASQDSIQLAITRFTEVRVDKIIFTKIDEAATVGVVLNVIRKASKSLSYITTGQNVPADIEVGGGGRLAQMILGMAG